MEKIPVDEMVEELQRMADELGRPPKSTEMNTMGEYSAATYQNRFGSWNAALSKAGMVPHRRRNEPDERLLDDIRRVAGLINKPPTANDIREHADYSLSTFVRRFGSWNDALKHAGLEVNQGSPGEGEYGRGWNPIKRAKVRERDGMECVECGKTNQSHMKTANETLHVHHLNPREEFNTDEEYNSIDNLATVCSGCHQQYHARDAKYDKTDWKYPCSHVVTAPKLFTPSEWCPICENSRGPIKLN